ncbi:hypothetical protein A3A71_02345 [Candidatus Berkelbacteria bacterium RIFCSPLOWO2_01_FULL_50_28]|uniref:Glycosyl transferase family 1 domain-containing protein n=1 Tax=Candidatus Berkelbacteria bacterium RIFCSPLOWO2_01_FULL_50_28 TaxID=1797471 RepID=A0A1F5ECC1_9BACT|nr:MAG: hypothetical protein A3F39_00760 [Candidatus Berkelbacteria bacterium RIFCSPHIGHO2_12_FULL_50_11]OGD64864.1 MAG: hypothetical protein A3A71_02345 [Candidatus Berkelbacteria bacterium RIFCSPLOWO2_01_FULL_50_28]
MMIIGIDASRATRTVRSGTENYSFELIRRLVTADKVNKFVLYTPNFPKEKWPEAKNITWRVLPSRRLWSQIQLAGELRREKPDVLFVPSHVVPLLSNLPTVVTIHDIAYRYFPKTYSKFDRRYLHFSTSVSLAKADAVIVPSQSTKSNIIKEYKANSAKVHIIPMAHNCELFNATRNYGNAPISSPYILFTGSIEEKKNIRLLIEAFCILAKSRKDILLVMIGKMGFGSEKIVDFVNTLEPSLASRIFMPGFVPKYDLLRYLRHAKLFAYPSSYDGFAFVVLEALSVGTPVVCSNSSSLPEIVDDAAVLLPPNNPLRWASTFAKILDSTTLASDLRQKGIKRAKMYSWDKTVQETLTVIRQVANG